MLKREFIQGCVEAGCDEAGRGCLAGPVFAAAVILPPDYENERLNDSKKLSPAVREKLRVEIEREALAWAVGTASNREIDEINILRASILAMHRALDGLLISPEHIIVDGNRFSPYYNIPYTTVVKGDGQYMSIAAASILAKTHRDEYMVTLDKEYPLYQWHINKGYPTEAHRSAIELYGTTPHHRLTFTFHH